MAAQATFTPYTICTWPLSNDLHAEAKKTLKGYSVSIINNLGQSQYRFHINPQHTFDHCVWKGNDNGFHSRLFCSKEPNQNKATLIVVNCASLRIFAYAFSNVTAQTLSQQRLTIQLNEENLPTVDWVPQEAGNEQMNDPAADADIERTRDCMTVAIDRVTAACQRTPCRMIATAAGYKVGELTLSAAYTATQWGWAAGWQAAEMIFGYAVKPIANYTIECLGVSGITVVVTVEAVRLANSYFPQHQILERIKSAAKTVVDKFI